MSEIKMSDVFELPVNKIMVHNGDLSHSETDYACIAINAYDANQERIKELESIAFKLQEFIVETYNQYNTDRTLGIKISLRGGALITESEAILGE
jgi:hypothetical protein